jgi:5'-nucleotidase
MISTLLNKIMVSCKEKNSELKMIRGKQLSIDSLLEEDSSFSNAIEPYKEELHDKVNEVLCFNPRNLSRNEAALESSLGNFYADACLETGDSLFFQETGKHIDFALFNYGGIRTAIPAGDVKVSDVFKLMPFENKLVVAKLTGEQVLSLFEYLKRSKSAHPVSGLKLVLDQDELSLILIQGKAFDRDKEYFVLTHDYLQHGGDNMAFFKNPVALYPLQYKVRDVLIDHLKMADTLKESLDGRFTKID